MGSALEEEAKRLYGKLSPLGWNLDSCRASASLTHRINRLKKKKDAVLLAHSYQRPEITYGVADFAGDSYALARGAQKSGAKIVIMCGVRFMAETAKLLSPEKRVFLPSPDARCSLADGITPQDVRALRKKHPAAPVICYVNTSAEVKAECDICCTSANAEKIIRALPDGELILVPDRFMARNLGARTGKRIIGHTACCIVHESFDPGVISAMRGMMPGTQVLAHTECRPEVVAAADMAGGTGDMERFVSSSKADSFMLITECGLAERFKAAFPNKRFVGSCSICPYMKKNTLTLVLDLLERLPEENEVRIAPEISEKARKPLERMMEFP